MIIFRNKLLLLSEIVEPWRVISNDPGYEIPVVNNIIQF